MDGMGTGSAADANGCSAVSTGNKANGVGGVSPISNAVGVVPSDTTSLGVCTFYVC